ncbi:hypothetical protein [Parapedobacter soli]|uniref:hypothetical protein n=1 Tax=Parapedobacter soli TaxID=416955 RepID=UPI0021C95989|nr:hypothetical protein [Parapedobacter soli]
MINSKRISNNRKKGGNEMDTEIKNEALAYKATIIKKGTSTPAEKEFIENNFETIKTGFRALNTGGKMSFIRELLEQETAIKKIDVIEDRFTVNLGDPSGKGYHFDPKCK